MPRKVQAFSKPERVLTSFDFIDIARGKSVVEFYGGKISGGASITDNPTFGASNIKWWSDDLWTDAVGGGGKRIDQDFDIDFKFAKIIEGDIIVNVPLGFSSSGAQGNVYADVLALHVNGAGVETEIGRGQTDKYTNGANAGKFYRQLCAKILNVDQRFAPGDTLRFSVQVYMTEVAGGLQLRLGHDPKNRSFAALGDTVDQDAPSQLTFQVPFKIFI